MNSWLHFYYLITFILILLFPLYYMLKYKEWLSFGIFFPCFYVLYSFIFPLVLIFHIYHPLVYFMNIKDNIYTYIAYTNFLIFYITWFIGFLGGIKKESVQKKFFLKRILDLRIIKLILLILTLTFSFSYVWGIYDLLISSFFSNRSLYELINSIRLNSLIRASYSLWGASIISMTSIIFAQSKKKKFNFFNLFWFVNLIMYLLIAFLIGDRGQLFIVLFAIFILYNLLVQRLSFLNIVTVLIFILILATFIRCSRGFNIFSLTKKNFGAFLNIHTVLNTIFLSAENIAPASSMFFLVSHEVPLLWGKSFIYLILSFIPRIIAPFRPLPSYSYSKYAYFSGLDYTIRGFCLHQASDWYFNFGISGLIIGGFLVGYIMALIENRAKKKNSLFSITIYASLCAWIPQLIRSPIEGYRAFIYEYALLPFFLFVFLKKLVGYTIKSKFTTKENFNFRTT